MEEQKLQQPPNRFKMAAESVKYAGGGEKEFKHSETRKKNVLSLQKEDKKEIMAGVCTGLGWFLDLKPSEKH